MQGHYKYTQIILAGIILCIVGFIIYMQLPKESFNNSSAIDRNNLFNDPRYEKDRTQLYGSLFLDGLDEQIKRMTDPRIQYDTKRIDIIKYADVLL